MMYDYGYMGAWMGGWSISHWLFFIVFVALVLYPLGLILKRLGYSPLWSVLAFVPLINLIGLWLVALNEPRK
jgi:hypothetical protein